MPFPRTVFMVPGIADKINELILETGGMIDHISPRAICNARSLGNDEDDNDIAAKFGLVNLNDNDENLKGRGNGGGNKGGDYPGGSNKEVNYENLKGRGIGGNGGSNKEGNGGSNKQGNGGNGGSKEGNGENLKGRGIGGNGGSNKQNNGEDDDTMSDSGDEVVVFKSAAYEKTILQSHNLNLPFSEAIPIIQESHVKSAIEALEQPKEPLIGVSVESTIATSKQVLSQSVNLAQSGKSELQTEPETQSKARTGAENNDNSNAVVVVVDDDDDDDDDDVAVVVDDNNNNNNNNTEGKEANPIAAVLNLQPVVRKFKLLNNENLACYSPLVVNTGTPEEFKAATINFWVCQDYDRFFGVQSFQKEIEIAKALRFEDDSESVALKNEKIIYITTRIVNPGKVLNAYFNSGPTKRDLYIDLILNNNGCNILLQLMKFFKENGTTIESKIDSVFLRISASYFNQIRVIFGVLTTNTLFYEKIKSLGLFVGLHQYANGYVFDALSDTLIKLPPTLEKLIVSNGLEITDFAQLPATLKEIGFHNVKMMNLSKFNLLKNLKYLCINGNEVKLDGRVESFPKGFRIGLETVKFDSSVSVSCNFRNFAQLTSLSLSNLSYTRTRDLTFPLMLRKLELIDCMISSNISAFPDTLRMLTIIRSKWSPKRNCHLARLQRFKIADSEVKDLKEKILACKTLLKLEVSNSSIDKIQHDFKFPQTLKILKLIKVPLKGVPESVFPNSLEIINLEENDLKYILSSSNLKAMRIAGNPIQGDVDLRHIAVKDVTLQNSAQLGSIFLNEETAYLNASYSSSLVSISGEGLTKVVLDGCKSLNLSQFKFPSKITQLSLKDCDFVKFDDPTVEIPHLRIMDLSNNKLESIDLSRFEHLQDVDISNNKLTVIDNSYFPQSIKSINAKENLIQEVKVAELKNIEWLQLSDNKIEKMTNVEVPEKLRTLILNNNNICEFLSNSFKIPMNLCHLELNKCKIAKFDQILPQKLMSCCLNGNKLHGQTFSIKFEKKSPCLKFLDLSSNYFKSFDFSLLQDVGVELSELNLASNMIEEVPQIPGNILSAILFKA
ncbi:hypothetical protein KGF56_001878 [Candida oxycetoniae]|uniref:Uncharacterized protein n=1 Tax=Candida oxycetoniae TaxID=497107 RepID=A0AAI9SYG8_9ASCO|nr:uncharacterized protein KGF56_001878 [Candida oxycetoniae]KAI3405307.2 hypothetical protein KGF56_001878 [Candida oxycetoniae]